MIQVMKPKHSFDRLIVDLFAGVRDPEPWIKFLPKLDSVFGAISSTIMVSPPNTVEPRFMAYTHDGKTQTGKGELYATEYFAIDPFVDLPEGQVTTIHEFLGDEFEQLEFYRHGLWMEAYYIAGFDVISTTGALGRLRICRSPDGKDFGQKSRDQLQRMVPFFREAINLYERLHQLETQAQTYTRTLDRMTVAAFFLGADGRILTTNQLGKKMLARSICSGNIGEKFAFGERSANEALKNVLEKAGKNEQLDTKLVELVSVEEVATNQNYHFALRPIIGPTLIASDQTPALAIYATNPFDTINVTPEAVAELYNLTSAEAKLCVALVNLLDLKTAANSLNIAHNTARAHLRSIFSKTGVTRQSELIRMIMRGLAELG